jgi:hypothetical protein
MGFIGRPNVSSQKHMNFNYNKWCVVNNKWRWLGRTRSDFKSKWRSVTGWDTHGKYCDIDLKSVDIGRGNNS